MLGLGLNIITKRAMASPFILNKVKDAAAAYGLRKLKSTADKAIRVRRSSDNTEVDIGYAGKDLDTAALTGFAHYSDLPSIPNPSLAVDGDSDGINDGWSTNTSGTATRVYSITNGYQRIDHTTTVTQSTYTRVRIGSLSTTKATEGDIINLQMTAKRVSQSGSGSAAIIIITRTSAGGFINSAQTIITSTNDTAVNLTHTCPATTAYFEIALNVQGSTAGDAAVLDCKDITVLNHKTSAYVTKWYDQSGNGRHATQATAANQPRIVNGGVIDIGQTGRPKLTFDGVDDYFSSNTPTVTQPLTIFGVAKVSSTSAAYKSFFNGSTTATQTLLQLSDTGNYRKIYSGAVLQSTKIMSSTSAEVWAAVFNGASSALYVNGTLDASGNAGTIGMNGFTIGCERGISWWPGDINEIVVYPQVFDSSNRQAIEREQMKYYNIT